MRRSKKTNNIFMGMIEDSYRVLEENQPFKVIHGVSFPNPQWVLAAAFLIGRHIYTIQSRDERDVSIHPIYFKGEEYIVVGLNDTEYTIDNIVELSEISDERWQYIKQEKIIPMIEEAVKKQNLEYLYYLLKPEYVTNIRKISGLRIDPMMAIIVDTKEIFPQLGWDKIGEKSIPINAGIPHHRVHNIRSHVCFKDFPFMSKADLTKYFDEISEREAMLNLI